MSQIIQHITVSAAGSVPVSFTPGAYNPASSNVESHLQAIDKKTLRYVDGGTSLSNDQNYIVGCDTSGGTVYVTFPASPTSGQYIKVQDTSGNAGVNVVKIIYGGATQFEIAHNYGAAEYFYDGSSWQQLSETNSVFIDQQANSLKIQQPVDEVALYKLSASEHVALQRIKTDYWIGIGFPDLNYNLPLHSKLYARVDGTASTAGLGTTFSGTWTTTVNSGSYGGNYTRSNTTNDYAEFTTANASRIVGAYISKASNGGYGLVSIDGDTTLATLLPTAQDEVDAGRLAASALVGGGGTLNPTDRVIDFYGNPLTPQFVRFADNLALTTHVLRITVTGYNRSPSSDTRVYIEGWFSGKIDGDELLAVKNLTNPAVNSEWVHAINCKPTGSGSDTFIGGIHANETLVSSTFYVDGESVSMTTGDILDGKYIQIVRQSNLFHPDVGAGATVVADNNSVMRISVEGLEIYDRIEWQQNMDIATAYNAMFPVDNTFNTGKISDGREFTLNSDDGSANGVGISQYAILFDSASSLYAGMALKKPEKTTLDYYVKASPSNKFFIQDRSGGQINKVYNTCQLGGTVTIGDIWESYSVRFYGYNYFDA